MGLWGSKKDLAAYNGEMTPGSIPVATPVTGVQQWSTKSEQVSTYQQASPKAPLFHHSDPTLSREPMMMRLCPNCHQESRTRITTYPTWQTWAASAGLLFVFWPVCWMPLVLDNCKQTDHHCVLCAAKVGKVDAFQDCCVTERS